MKIFLLLLLTVIPVIDSWVVFGNPPKQPHFSKVTLLFERPTTFKDTIEERPIDEAFLKQKQRAVRRVCAPFLGKKMDAIGAWASGVDTADNNVLSMVYFTDELAMGIVWEDDYDNFRIIRREETTPNNSVFTEDYFRRYGKVGPLQNVYLGLGKRNAYSFRIGWPGLSIWLDFGQDNWLAVFNYRGSSVFFEQFPEQNPQDPYVQEYNFTLIKC